MKDLVKAGIYGAGSIRWWYAAGVAAVLATVLPAAVPVAVAVFAAAALVEVLTSAGQARLYRYQLEDMRAYAEAQHVSWIETLSDEDKRDNLPPLTEEDIDAFAAELRNLPDGDDPGLAGQGAKA